MWPAGVRTSPAPRSTSKAVNPKVKARRGPAGATTLPVHAPPGEGIPHQHPVVDRELAHAGLAAGVGAGQDGGRAVAAGAVLPRLGDAVGGRDLFGVRSDAAGGGCTVEAYEQQVPAAHGGRFDRRGGQRTVGGWVQSGIPTVGARQHRHGAVAGATLRAAAAALNVDPRSINVTSSKRPASPSLHLRSSMSGLPRRCSCGDRTFRRGPDNPPQAFTKSMASSPSTGSRGRTPLSARSPTWSSSIGRETRCTAG